MSFFHWTDIDGMGVAIFDAEHRVAIELGNRLHEAVERGEAGPALRHVVQRLARYADEHFTHEEEYMRLSGYAGQAEHEAAHRKLKDQISRFQDLLHDECADRERLACAVLEFFRDWLIEHIHTEDQLLGAHLIARGIR